MQYLLQGHVLEAEAWPLFLASDGTLKRAQGLIYLLRDQGICINPPVFLEPKGHQQNFHISPHPSTLTLTLMYFFASQKFVVRRLDCFCLCRLGAHADPDSKARSSLSSLYRPLDLGKRENQGLAILLYTSHFRLKVKINSFSNLLKSVHLLQATEEIMTCTLFYSENVSRSHTFNFHCI